MKANGKLQTKFNNVESLAKTALSLQGQLKTMKVQYEKLKLDHENALVRLQEAEETVRLQKKKSSQRLIRQTSSRLAGIMASKQK